MLTDLGWLPQPPADFEARVRELRRRIVANETLGLDAQVTALATAALDENRLHKLSRLAGDILKHRPPLGGLHALKVGLVGDGTLSLLGPAIVGTALRHGLILDIVEGGYNSAVQEAVDPTSEIRSAGLDMAIVVPDARLLGLDQAAGSALEADDRIDAAFARTKMIVDGLKGSVSSAIFVQTVVPALEPLFGSFDRIEPTSPFSMVEALNRRLAAWAADGAVVLIDVARLAATVGLEHWDDQIGRAHV